MPKGESPGCQVALIRCRLWIVFRFVTPHFHGLLAAAAVSLYLAAMPSCLKQYESVPGPARYDEDPGAYKVNKPEKKMESLMESLLSDLGVSDDVYVDPALRAAARNISLYFKAEGVELIDKIESVTIKNYLDEMGVTESAYQTLFLHVGKLEQTRGAILDAIGNEIKTKRFTNYGIGVARTWLPPSYIVSILMTRKAIELEPFPRAVFPHRDYKLTGYVTLPGNQLTVYVQGRNGAQSVSPYLSGDGSFSQVISFSESGSNIVEMMLDGLEGPEVAALFTVRVEGEDSGEETETLDRVAVNTISEARKRIFELVNMEREKVGLKKVKYDAKATQVAQKYAEEMLKTGKVSHISAASGDVATRAKAQGLRFARITENVAVNQSAEDVHEGFMGSPAHRMNIVDSHVDKGGIGVAFSKDKSHMYVVEIFVKYL